MSPERAPAPLGRRLAEVTGHRRAGAYHVVSCADPDGPDPEPGQFYMLAAEDRWGGGEGERPFLPRASSFLRRHGTGTLEFLLEGVGPGTRRLCELRAGDALWLAGPFGRGFAPPRRHGRPLLVGGGVGIAPLAAWQDRLGAAALVLLGFRDAAHAEGAALLPGARVATDDGAAGHHGRVTDLLAAELGCDPRAEVYACGPPPMLEAVRGLCAREGVPAQLALESGMACGYGACFGCVVPTRRGLVRLCLEGPVLDAEDVEELCEAGHGRSEADHP